MKLKTEHFIEAYFDEWAATLSRAQKLLENSEYHLEGLLLLSCYIGAFARLRYPSKNDAESYKEVVLRYSGREDLYSSIDLLFLLQWPKSAFRNSPDYKKLQSYQELATTIARAFGDEAALKADDSLRYKSPQEVLSPIEARPFKGLDMVNVRSNIGLFSNLELLYRVVRCSAVHENIFPLVNEIYYPDTDERDYAPNHAITGDVLLETSKEILRRLRQDCMDSGKTPFELWT